jgi:hypothetical protein
VPLNVPSNLSTKSKFLREWFGASWSDYVSEMGIFGDLGSDELMKETDDTREDWVGLCGQDDGK